MVRTGYYSQQAPPAQYYQQSDTFPPQQFTLPVSSSAVQYGQQQEHYYYTQNQPQPSVFQGQSYGADVQQQQPNYEPYPFQQSSYPVNNVVYNNSALTSSTFSQPSNQNPQDYLQWLQHIQRSQGGMGNIERPWWMWCIGWCDVLYAIYLAVTLIYKTFVKPVDVDSDEDSMGASIYQLFLGFLGVLLRLLMGIGLLTGLKSNDDSNTLWYCKIWAGCQLVLVIISTIGLIAAALIYATYIPATRKERPAVLRIFAVLVGRVIALILVRYFIGQLKKSEALSFGNGMHMMGNGVAYSEQRQADEQEEVQENKRYEYGSGMCGPSVAVIMSL